SLASVEISWPIMVPESKWGITQEQYVNLYKKFNPVQSSAFLASRSIARGTKSSAGRTSLPGPLCRRRKFIGGPRRMACEACGLKTRAGG
ncbi:MAG: hypothetical protein LAP13_23805, partial [Acidobacteriia bacterium]|nr:hypothetical protein [Terriglobia bacterium]